MTARARKIVRDLRLERARTALVVLAIALGIAAFSSVLGTYGVLARELNRGYLATNPASATLHIDGVDDKLVAAVLADRDVSDAEPRRTLSGRIKAGPGEWRNLVLFVVRDFAAIRVNLLKPQEGAWPPAAGEILIERDAMQVARGHIGDTVLVKTTDGHEQMLRLAGTVHDAGQAQARMENHVYGYITADTLPQLGERSSFDALHVLVARDRFNEEHIRSVAANLRQNAEGMGYVVRGVSIPVPGKHPHADIMGLLLLSISAFGFFVLALSGILVVNLMAALMGAQVRQIGVMKALGARRAQIAGIYLAQAALMGVAALAVALPLGAWGSVLLCRYMAAFLNFDIASFAAPLWIYGLIALAGVAVPLLSAAYPVWKFAARPARVALAATGAAAESFGVGGIDRMLANLGGPFRPVLLAIRNNFRRRTRFVLTVATLATAGLFFLSALDVRTSLVYTLDRLFGARQYDLAVRLASLYPWEKVEGALRTTPKVARFEPWVVTEGALPSDTSPAPVAAHRIHVGDTTASSFVSIVALPPETSMLHFDIARGRALQAGDGDAMVWNSALAARRPRVRPGDRVTMRVGPSERSWQVVGIVREPFSQPTAYISLPYLEQAGGHHGIASQARVALVAHDRVTLDAAKAAIDRSLESAGVRAVSIAGNSETRFSFDQHVLMIYVFLILMSVVIAGVGGLGLATSLSLNVMERRREMGVLRAIGATPGTVAAMVAGEGLVAGLIGWALAALAAGPVTSFAGNHMVMAMFRTGIDFRTDVRGIGIWLGVSILLALAASVIPAWRAAGVTVREALTCE
jgi:putative ABC transport system permease protein